MIARLAEFLLNRTRRERWLIALLVLVALPTGIGIGVLQPLAEASRHARAEAEEARALRDWVSLRAAEAMALAPLTGSAADAAGAPVGISRLDLSLREAGLRDVVATLSNRGAGEVELGFEAVRFTELAAWLDAMDGGWGYDIASLRLDRGAAGDLVSARLVLRPAE